jgi:hypothetical protein
MDGFAQRFMGFPPAIGTRALHWGGVFLAANRMHFTPQGVTACVGRFPRFFS